MKQRLINADEVYGKRFTVVDVMEGVPVHRNVVKAVDVKEASTVEAIPVEWIEQYIDEHWSDEVWCFGKSLELLIQRWREENHK